MSKILGNEYSKVNIPTQKPVKFYWQDKITYRR